MSKKQNIPRLSLFPLTAEVNNKGNMAIGGCDTVRLAAKFGTPLYVFDEVTLHKKCAEFREEFVERYPDTTVIYASKAFTHRALLKILAEEELGLDVVSGGEMGIARSAGFPMERLFFHGNNKSAEELKTALEWRIGRIVVDNFHELAMLSRIAAEMGVEADILLRVTPGIDPHTHKFITTGNIDSKFGIPLAELKKAACQSMSLPNLNPVGLHCHLGSLIFETDPYPKAIEVLLEQAVELKKACDFELKELNIGGGYAVQYTLDSPDTPVSAYAKAIASKIKSTCKKLGIAEPHLVIEPGRAIVAQAGVALYTVGVIKDIPGVRRYVSVDGGMGDNIRPAIYGSQYEAMVANKPQAKNTDKVTIAGKFCESGDILIKDIDLPPIAAGDILAVPDCGAYCIPMSSNYNAFMRPAVVMVKDGKARLIRRRETVDDLHRCDA